MCDHTTPPKAPDPPLRHMLLVCRKELVGLLGKPCEICGGIGDWTALGAKDAKCLQCHGYGMMPGPVPDSVVTRLKWLISQIDVALNDSYTGSDRIGFVLMDDFSVGSCESLKLVEKWEKEIADAQKI
jgi:hypothetical protein